MTTKTYWVVVRNGNGLEWRSVKHAACAVDAQRLAMAGEYTDFEPVVDDDDDNAYGLRDGDVYLDNGRVLRSGETTEDMNP